MGSAPVSEDAGDGVPASAAVPLEGTRWRLAAYRDAAGALAPARTEAPRPTDAAGLRRAVIVFAGGSWSGSAGCNELSGEYAKAGVALRMSFGVSTLRNCHGQRMAQEAGFLTALPAVATYRIVGRALELLRPDGTVAVRFAAVAEPPGGQVTETAYGGSPRAGRLRNLALYRLVTGRPVSASVT